MNITDGQKLALIKLCQKFVKGRDGRLWILSQLLNKEVNSTSELSINDWRKIRDMAYPHWPDNDWTISDEFMSIGNNLRLRYEKEVLGQMALF